MRRRCDETGTSADHRLSKERLYFTRESSILDASPDVLAKRNRQVIVSFRLQVDTIIVPIIFWDVDNCLFSQEALWNALKIGIQCCLTGNNNLSFGQIEVTRIGKVVHEKTKHCRMDVLRECQGKETFRTLVYVDLVWRRVRPVCFDKIIQYVAEFILVPSPNHNDLIVNPIRRERRNVSLRIDLHRLCEKYHRQHR